MVGLRVLLKGLQALLRQVLKSLLVRQREGKIVFWAPNCTVVNTDGTVQTQRVNAFNLPPVEGLLAEAMNREGLAEHYSSRLEHCLDVHAESVLSPAHRGHVENPRCAPTPKEKKIWEPVKAPKLYPEPAMTPRIAELPTFSCQKLLHTKVPKFLPRNQVALHPLALAWHSP